MNPRVKQVEAKPDYQLLLTFSNNEHRLFDAKPYITKGIFVALQDAGIFNKVKPFNGSVLWPDDLDLCPDTLYEESVPVG